MAADGAGNGLYDYLYKRFFAQRDSHEGYSFQQAPGGSAPTRMVTFTEKLQWWALDRRRRRKQILAERDQLQQDIIHIAKSGQQK
jgi:hypothetical protein